MMSAILVSGLCLGDRVPVWAQQAPAPLIITMEALPQATPRQEYRFQLQATGGVPPLHWSIAEGTLPEGLQLDPSGVISGIPTELGDFDVALAVADSAPPAHSTTREFTIKVMAPLSLQWSAYPRVENNEISGSVKISNGTKDDFDQTFIIVAVNEIGKAFALGYQHFKLKANTLNLEIPFGSSVPQGTYVVHADAVAEVPDKDTIHRGRLQTPEALNVTAGP